VTVDTVHRDTGHPSSCFQNNCLRNAQPEKDLHKQLAEKVAQSFRSELRAVKGGLRQSTQSFGYLCGGDAMSRLDGFTDDKLSQHRSAGYRRDAALRLEAHRRNCAVLDARSEAQNVAAYRIRYFDGGAGVREVARIARIFEMVEDRARVHGRKFTVEKQNSKAQCIKLASANSSKQRAYEGLAGPASRALGAAPFN